MNNKYVMYVGNLILGVLLLNISNAVSAKDYNIMDFGAKGNGISDDAYSIQKAIDACSSGGGGVVIFPSGKIFISGPIEIKSHVTIYLNPNVVWKANPNASIYHLSVFGKNRGEGMKWIYANHAENISIIGEGTIDGNGVAFMGRELSDSYELKPVTTFDPRPHVLTLKEVKNLTIRDVTIREGAYWTIHLIGCENVTINGINLLNNLKIRNGDGIDIDHSRQVRISNCYITSGDDAICLKNRREFQECGPCKNIVVNNCVLTSRSCAIKIGSENVDSICDVQFSNCIIKDSNRGLGIQNRDEGTVTNVVFSNIILGCQLWSDVWWGKAEPIYVTSYPRAKGNNKDADWRYPKNQSVSHCGNVSYIYFNGIYAMGENGCYIGGDVPQKVNHIYFNNVFLTLRPITSYKGGVYDRRPCKGAKFIRDKIYGLYVDTASDVVTINFHVEAKCINFGGKEKRVSF